MSHNNRIYADDSAATDAFGRLRVSEPVTIFDSKQIFDTQPLVWDDAEQSGAGTATAYDNDRASTILTVADETAGNRIRQTFQRFNYQPGKSQQVLMTGIMGTGVAGITTRIGAYDAENGLFFEQDGVTLNVVTRSFVTGSAVDVAVAQADWNMDKMDGTGASGRTLDMSMAQIFCIDYEWLGVGRVRFGFYISGKVIYCHEIENANSKTSVYMSSPNLPLRYEIDNDATGPEHDLEHICGTVVSEGGQQAIGLPRYASTDGTHVDANVIETIYAVVGLRLKAANLACRVDMTEVAMLAETNASFEWILKLNPTVAGTFTYSDLDANACVQVARGALANTVTSGTDLAGGWSSQFGTRSIQTALESSAIKLGSAIDGTRDEIVLCVRPLAVNLDIQGSLGFREIQ